MVFCLLTCLESLFTKLIQWIMMSLFKCVTSQFADVVETESMDANPLDVQQRIAIVRPYTEDIEIIVPQRFVEENNYFDPTHWILLPHEDPGADILPYLPSESHPFTYEYTEGPVLEDQDRYSHAGPHRLLNDYDVVFTVDPDDLDISHIPQSGQAALVFAEVEVIDSDYESDDVPIGHITMPNGSVLLESTLDFINLATTITAPDSHAKDAVRQHATPNLEYPIGVIAHSIPVGETGREIWMNTHAMSETNLDKFLDLTTSSREIIIALFAGMHSPFLFTWFLGRMEIMFMNSQLDLNDQLAEIYDSFNSRLSQ